MFTLDYKETTVNPLSDKVVSGACVCLKIFVYVLKCAIVMKSVGKALMCVLVWGVCALVVSTEYDGTLPGQAHTHTHTRLFTTSHQSPLSLHALRSWLMEIPFLFPAAWLIKLVGKTVLISFATEERGNQAL